ncbi:hypothetical protein P43SY_007329 [Pythium insidiosum]|uniref:Cyclin-like domain-containing protein n=1 Tax=Pythium insidiosum TaxID=114742 RepID=A0AAD5LQ70_PYTIN|nr:hypothetical protein P43SY_007329 [Pythium insidiosum]
MTASSSPLMPPTALQRKRRRCTESDGSPAAARRRHCSELGVVTPSPSPPRPTTAPSPAGVSSSVAAAAASTGSVASAHRDEIVAAILTITSALGLAKETLHICVDLLDRYLAAVPTDAAHLETLSIACLWIAVKFTETPETIAAKSIKSILKRRRHSGNWTWAQILRQESEILRVLEFRIISPTVLAVLQRRLHDATVQLPTEKIHLAYYFADLLLLKHQARQYDSKVLVDAIWFVLEGHRMADVQPSLLAPVVILYLAHRDNINPRHPVFKTWFALRCLYSSVLPAPWTVPSNSSCACRVCEHADELLAQHIGDDTPTPSHPPASKALLA